MVCQAATALHQHHLALMERHPMVMETDTETEVEMVMAKQMVFLVVTYPHPQVMALQ